MTEKLKTNICQECGKKVLPNERHNINACGVHHLQRFLAIYGDYKLKHISKLIKWADES